MNKNELDWTSNMMTKKNRSSELACQLFNLKLHKSDIDKVVLVVKGVGTVEL